MMCLRLVSALLLVVAAHGACDTLVGSTTCPGDGIELDIGRLHGPDSPKVCHAACEADGRAGCCSYGWVDCYGDKCLACTIFPASEGPPALVTKNYPEQYNAGACYGTGVEAPVVGTGVVAPVVGTSDLVQLAVDTPDLSTLVDVLKKATLIDTLSGVGPFTVFAPTNDAFTNMDQTYLDKLLEPANKDALFTVLTYHVVSGKVLSSDLSNGQKIATRQGSVVEVTITGEEVKINNAKVTTPNIAASNGVVHLINAVLIPPEDTDVGSGSTTKSASILAFVGAFVVLLA